MSISKGKMRLDRTISQIHNWGLDPRYLSNSLCTDAPPPLRKYQGERRLWIAVVNRVPVNIYVNYSVCFPSDSWKGVDRPTPLLLFLFPPFPRSPCFPCSSCSPFSFCSPDPPILYFPLFPLFAFSLVTLFPPFPLLPCSSCYPCSSCSPVSLVSSSLCSSFSLVPLFLLFPCSPCSPFSALALVFLFPLFPCSPCSPVCVFWLSLWFYFELCAKNKLIFLRFLFYCSLQISFVTVLAYCNKQLSLEESLLALTNVSLEHISVQ